MDAYLSYGARVICVTMIIVIVKLIEQKAWKQLICGAMRSFVILNLIRAVNEQFLKLTSIHAFYVLFADHFAITWSTSFFSVLMSIY